MQSDFEYSMPPAGLHGQHESGQSVVSSRSDYAMCPAEVVELLPGIQASGAVNSLEEVTRVEELLEKQRGRRKPSRSAWHLMLIAGDGVLLVAAFALAVQLATRTGLVPSSGAIEQWNIRYVLIWLILASWALAVSVTQSQQLDCAASVLKSPLYALYTLALMCIFSLLPVYLFLGGQVLSYASLFLILLAVVAPLLSTWRIALAEIINLPRFRRQALIVGMNEAGKSVAGELLRANHPGINVLGYIDEDVVLHHQSGGLPVFGGRSALRQLTQGGVVDLLIMAIDYQAHPDLFREALEGAQLGISLVPVTLVYESASGKIPVEYIVDQWHVALAASQPVKPLYLCWRKVIDLVFGACGLVLLSLLLPVLALLIRLDSPGPIFFSQERAGYHGRTFRIRKFRSMRAGGEREENGAWVSKGDARVTRIGRVLRMTHLDELPQALNILRGEMSLIGPRPERPDYVAELAKDSPFYRYRLSVKPGLTGWAQVKYGYGSSEQDELVKLQYDLYYIKHQSFLLDVFILLKTIAEVVRCHGI